MGMEDFSRPIEDESIEEHEKKLGKRLVELQFKYIGKVYSGELPPLDPDINKEGGFLGLLETYTNLLEIVRSSYFSRKGKDFLREEFMTFYNNLLDEISILFEADKMHWIPQAESLIKARLDEIGPEQKFENPHINESRKKHRIGLISYKEEEITEVSLLHEGFKGMAGISIHFDPIYITRKSNENEDFRIDTALSELARRIVSEYPETQVVYGKSWMIDTNNIKRRGFRMIELASQDIQYTSDSFWGQFVNREGQIDNQKVEEFLRTGVPKHKVMVGYLPVLEFLKRYLPKDQRGTIALKKFNRDIAVKSQEERQRIKSEIVSKWDSIDENDIYTIFSDLPIFQGFLATKEGAGFDVFLAELKKRGEPITSIKNDPNFIVYDEAFPKYESGLVYTDSKVTID